VTARNQTAAVIGSGDFIGAAIAKKLAAEGFTLFVGGAMATNSHHWSTSNDAYRIIRGLEYEFSAQHLNA
jgi:NAD(P)-dependent dehydrogenase (short-subunit alcohol dehydrogenase family)